MNLKNASQSPRLITAHASLIALTCFGFGVMSLQRAGALTPGTVITTSPTVVDLSAPPGTSTSTTLAVQNNGLKAVTINVKLDKFGVDDATGQERIMTPTSNDPSLSWVHFSQTSFMAEPGVWKTVTMTTALPKQAALGYYYAVLFEASPTQSSVPNSNTIRGANAVFVLVDAHVPGESRTLTVQQFTSSRTVYQFLPASFNVTVRNKGNIFVVPAGDIYISRTPSGPTIDTIDINSGLGNVLPTTNRTFHVTWDNGFPAYQPKRIAGQIVTDSSGKPVMELNWDIGHITRFRFGHYYARLVLVYNSGSRDVPIHAEVSFWVIPWVLVGGLILVLLLLLLGVWTIVRAIITKAKGRGTQRWRNR